MTNENASITSTLDRACDDFADAALAWLVALDAAIPNLTGAAQRELQRCRDLAAVAGYAADMTDSNASADLLVAWGLK